MMIDPVVSKERFPESVDIMITLAHVTHQALRERCQRQACSESGLAAALLDRALRRMSV